MRFKEVKKLIQEETLLEVNMSPSNLRKLAKDINAKAGMEFEMIVPDVNNEDEGEQEIDWDQDESTSSIDDIIRFFDDDIYNSQRDLRNLRDELQSEYSDWQVENMDEYWSEEEDYSVYQWVKNNAPDDEIREALGLDADHEITKKEYQEFAEFCIAERNDYYEDAKQDWEDDYFNEDREEKFLDARGYSTMMDIQSNFNITWPHYYNPNEGQGADIADVADEFSRAIGRPVNWSSSYHGAQRAPNHYVIEPDGSLEPDDDTDAGLEFVSPPLPIDEMLSDLQKVKQWANDKGCYTGAGNNTGLHINVSIPDYSDQKLDYVKLALLLGDEHVLSIFDRLGNTYCKSALGIVQKKIKENPDAAKGLLDNMRSHLEALASKSIHNGYTDKFTSINTKGNYIEFRSAGGDWLNDNFDLIEPTMLRFVVALDAAMDPDKYRKEYLTKLYKVLAPSGNKDTIDYFAKYVAGEMPKAALKSFVRQAQLERNVARQKDKGVKMWWNVAWTNGRRMEVVATNEMDAKLTAAKEWGIVASDANLSSMTVKPLRPYDDAAGEPQVVAQQPTTPQWGIWDIQRGGFVNSRGGVGPDRGRLIGGDTYDAARNAARNNGLLDRLEGGEFEIRQIPQQQPAPQSQTQSQQGNWGIWIQNADRFANQPGEYPRGATPPLYRFPSREAAEQWIEQQRAERPNMRTDIEVREIEPAAPIPGSTLDLQRQRAAQPRGEQSSYELYRISDGRTVTAPAGNPIQFLATSPEDAESKIERYVSDFGLGSVSSYAVRSVLNVPAQSSGEFTSTENVPREGHPRNLVPTGPGPWEIYRISNGESVRQLEHTNRAAAEEEARSALGLRGEAPELYGVRTRQTAQDRPWQDSDYDAALARARAADAADAAQGGGFTGEWKIVGPDGREVYRFSGVGNVQADANRVAMDWLMRNRQHMVDGTEVLPVMG